MIKKFALLAAASALLAACGQTVDAGQVGVEKRFGEVSSEGLQPGWHWYNPFTTDIIPMNVRVLKWVGQTETYTADIQQATVKFTVTYQIDPSKVPHIYRTLGLNWAQRVMPQVVLQSLKDEFGKWDAVAVVANRSEVQRRIYARIQPRLAKADIHVLSFDVVNVDYNKAFEDAVEAKQVAIQRATEERNHTVQVEEKAKQTVLTAEADAQATRLQAEALANNQRLVEYEAVKRWNGQLPTNMYGSAPLPFISVGQ